MENKDKIIDDNLKLNQDIERCKYKTYLIGSMESAGDDDGGKGWRLKISPPLIKRNVFIFNPTREEISKVGMPTGEFMSKLEGWQLSGNWELFVKNMDKIWVGRTYMEKNEDDSLHCVRCLGDIDYVSLSDFLIWNYQEGDNPGGTYIELALAWAKGIPVYLVTSVPKHKFNKSILYFLLSSGHDRGRIFPNNSQLLDFLDDEYNLKVTKETKEEKK